MNIKDIPKSEAIKTGHGVVRLTIRDEKGLGSGISLDPPRSRQMALDG